MRFAAGLVGILGALLGLVATGLVAAAGGADPRSALLAAASCLLALAAAALSGRRPRRRAVQLLLAVAGLGAGIGEAALIPGAALLLAALLAWLGRGATAAP